ncbi:MAG: type II toxin-antitoxin system Phd/YefM family antitoxin [Burkholderiaceae bacterium]
MSAVPHTWQVQEAKNRFSELIDLARTQGDQVVTRHGKPVAMVVAYAAHASACTVTVSAEHYEALKRQAAAVPAKMTAKEFGATYKDWVAEQNRIVQEVGIFGAEYRVW